VPASTANKTTGRVAAVCTSVTYTAELVSVSISLWAATACIQPPTLLTNCASHIAANSRLRNGAHSADAVPAATPSAN
jgi:hypothetical protein